MSILRIAIVIALATTIAFTFACGAYDESTSGYTSYPGTFGEPGSPGQSGEARAFGVLGEPGAPGEPGEPGAPIISTVVVESEVMFSKVADVENEKFVEIEAVEAEEAIVIVEAEATKAPSTTSDDQAGQNVDISFQPTNRIIVRNANMSVESNDPIATIDDISDLAVSRGGWVVNSNTSDNGFYNITIRIPAETLDAVIEQITANVAKVISVNSDSTDFTEEYIDLGARRSTVQETVDALTELLRSENYDSVEELLEVQREITNWQAELERIDGRLAFIRESAAFSRLSVTVNRAPIPMRVDVGEDVHVGIGIGRKYTARFFPPEDYDRYEITWDFGDGSEPQTFYSGLRTQGEDGLLSIPARHTYFSDEFSPHVVTVRIKAFSDRGLAEGEDQLWANVSELPRFDTFVTASEWNVEAGQPVTLTASFNHPDTLRNVEYSWDFRDGSPVVEGTVAPGDTGIEVEHTFDRHRPENYQIVFEIRGDSDAGEVMESRIGNVGVYPGPEIESSNFNPGNTVTEAVNVLIEVSAFAGTAAIWLAITSPIWLILGAIAFFIIRFTVRRQRKVQRVVYVPTQPDDNQASDDEDNPTAST